MEQGNKGACNIEIVFKLPNLADKAFDNERKPWKSRREGAARTKPITRR